MFRHASLPFAEGGTPGASITGGVQRAGGSSTGGAPAAAAAVLASEAGGFSSLAGATGRLAAFEEAEQETPPEFHLDTKFYEELHTNG